MTYSIRIAQFEDWDKVSQHFFDHFKEFGHIGVEEDVNPDKDMYEMILSHHGYMCVVMEDDKTKDIIGYIGGVITPHLHYKGVKFVTTDVMYVKKGFGRKKRFLALLKEFERVAKESWQASYIQVVSNANKDISGLMNTLGYKTSDIVVTNKL